MGRRKGTKRKKKSLEGMKPKKTKPRIVVKPEEDCRREKEEKKRMKKLKMCPDSSNKKDKQVIHRLDPRIGTRDSKGRVDCVIRYKIYRVNETMQDKYYRSKVYYFNGMCIWLEHGKHRERGQTFLALFVCAKPDPKKMHPVVKEGEEDQDKEWKVFMDIEFRSLSRDKIESKTASEFSPVIFSNETKAHGHFDYRVWSEICGPDKGFIDSDDLLRTEAIIKDMSYFLDVEYMTDFQEFEEVFIDKNESLLPHSHRLLRSDMRSDVVFVVGKEDAEKCVPAHLEILGQHHELITFIHNKMTETGGNRIDLRNEPFICPRNVAFMDYIALSSLLSFFYRKEIALQRNSIVQLFAFADYFNVKPVRTLCLEKINEDTQFYFIRCLEYFLRCDKIEDFNDFIEEYARDLKKMITRDVTHDTSDQKNSLINTSRKLMKNLLISEAVAFDELDLFRLTVSWARRECKKRGIKENGYSMRHVLGEDIIRSIRFPVIRENDFNQIVLHVNLIGLLTDEEIVYILGCFSQRPSRKRGDSSQNPALFSSLLRKGQMECMK